MLINKIEWQRIFIQDIKDKLRESRVEFNKYKQTNKVVHLQQAGNKLFSVVENWMMVKHGKRVGSYSELKQLVKNDKNDYKLIVRASRLHYFFYATVVVDDIDDIAYEYAEIYNIMKRRVDNLKDR